MNSENLKPTRSLKKFLRNLFTKNIGLKLLAILFAVIAWFLIKI